MASLTGAPTLALRCLRCPPHRHVGWMAAATPTSPPCCARPLGCEHGATPLAVAALGRWPCCRNRGCAIVSPPWSSTLLLWEHSCEFLLLLLASVHLLWWPGQRARHACLCCCCAMLLLLLCSSLCYCCCCSARAYAVSLCTLLL
jgi:hypothetical protein